MLFQPSRSQLRAHHKTWRKPTHPPISFYKAEKAAIGRDPQIALVVLSVPFGVDIWMCWRRKIIIIYSPFILFKSQEKAALRKSKFCFLFRNVSFVFFLCGISALIFFFFLRMRDSYKLSSDCLWENFYLVLKFLRNSSKASWANSCHIL